MSLQEKADTQMALGVYFHIPFCARPCDFCAFYEEAPKRSDIERFLQGMERELALISMNRPVETVFWGGGTPGLLPPRDLQRLGQAMLQCLQNSPGEWTVEMAPSTVKREKLRVLRDLGVNRISLGVQSFHPAMLETLGRSHAPKQVCRAIELIKEMGFENLNLDLIFSIPGQSIEDWLDDLQMAVAAQPQHISTYCLTFEEDTALWLQRQKGQTSAKTEAEETAFYEKSAEFLPASGYYQYEISNYCQPGFACRHNLNTWKMTEWIGFGPSAASQYAGLRHANVASLDEWLKGVSEGKPRNVERTMLNPDLLFADSLIFGLRMNEGIDLPALKNRFAPTKAHLADELWLNLQAEGLLEGIETGKLKLTKKGLLLADRIGVEILSTLEDEIECMAH